MATAKNTATGDDKTANIPPQGNALVSSTEAFSNEELAGIKSFAEALSFLGDKLGEANVLNAAEEIGDGFRMLDEKDQLIGVEMLIVSWDFHMGTYGEFVSCKIVTADNQKFVVIDGSTGLRDQMMGLTAKTGKKQGLYCKNGLRRSDYNYTDENGKETPAQTYYLDTSA